MDSNDLDTYRRELKRRLHELAPIFANAAIGDFSQDVQIPEKDDELTVMLVGVQLMLEAIREKQQESEESLTKLNEVNAELQHEKAQYEAILSSMAEGMIVVDKDARITIINQAGADMLGINRQKVVGQNYYSIVTTKDRDGQVVPIERRPLHLALTAGTKQIKTLSDGLHYVRADGSLMPVAITASPVIFDKKIIGGVSTFQDITGEEELDKTKGEIISIASHQLRTPLTAIKWLSEQMLAPVRTMNRAELRKNTQRIHSSNERMITLVNDLLNVSRIELGTISLSYKPYDLPKAIDEIVNEIKAEIKNKHLKVTTHIEPGLDAIVTDPRHLQVILQNLITNAVKYTPEKHQVTIAASKEHDKLHLTVKDTGYGIPAKQQSQIFSKLFRADNARKSVTDGTGLGLYVGKAMVDQLGGKIWFESVEDEGTTFFVVIPLIAKAQTASSKQATTAAKSRK